MGKIKKTGKEYFKTISIEVGGDKFEAYFNAFTPLTLIKANATRKALYDKAVKDNTSLDVVEIGFVIAESLFAGFSNNIKEKTFTELAKGSNLELSRLVEECLAWCLEYLQELNGIKKK